VLNNPIMYNDPSGHCVGAQGHEFPDGHPACNVGGNGEPDEDDLEDDLNTTTTFHITTTC